MFQVFQGRTALSCEFTPKVCGKAPEVLGKVHGRRIAPSGNVSTGVSDISRQTVGEMDLHATRKRRLQQLLDERYGGVQARLAEAIRRPANYIWRLLSEGPHAKGIGEDLARLIEDKSGVERYWLDRDDEMEQKLLEQPHGIDHNVVRPSLVAPRAVPVWDWEGLKLGGWSRTNREGNRSVLCRSDFGRSRLRPGGQGLGHVPRVR